MDIKYHIENEYIKCVLQIHGFSGLRTRVWSSHWVGSKGGGGVGRRHAGLPHTLKLVCLNYRKND